MTSDEAQNLLLVMSRRVPDKLILFARAIEGSVGMPDGWPYFLERTEKWSHEFALWEGFGCPQDGDQTWEEFVQSIDVLAGTP